MLDSLKLNPRVTQYGCGIYEAGDSGKCFVKLFVTDTGRVLPVNHRIITEDDLMQAYVWGREDAEELSKQHIQLPGVATPRGGE